MLPAVSTDSTAAAPPTLQDILSATRGVKGSTSAKID
jgi:hypothetical protein